MRRCRIDLPNRCYHLISRVAHRAYFRDEGRQAANRKGRAVRARKTYCGNLLWQSSLTLLAPDYGNGETERFAYDKWNRLAKHTRGRTEEMYRYDHFGRLVEKKESGDCEGQTLVIRSK